MKCEYMLKTEAMCSFCNVHVTQAFYLYFISSMSQSSVYLDPLNQAFVDAAAAGPPLQDLTVEQFRAEVDQLQQHTPIPGVTLTEFIVDFEDGVTTYIFKPDGSPANLLVVLFIHGGAWIAGKYDHRRHEGKEKLTPVQRQLA